MYRAQSDRSVPCLAIRDGWKSFPIPIVAFTIVLVSLDIQLYNNNETVHQVNNIIIDLDREHLASRWRAAVQ